MKTTTNPTTTPSHFLGIDVGKTDLYCHIIGPGTPSSERFDNTPAGIGRLGKWLSKSAPQKHTGACLEQTGHYSMAVATALHAMPLRALHVVNPHQIKAYGKQKLRRNKSDPADARLIARFLQAEHHDLHPWHPRSPLQQRITELARYADSITRDNARLKTKIEAAPEKTILTSLNRRIKAQEKEIKSTRLLIRKLLKSDPALQAKSDLLGSIPGLGETTVQIVLGELPDLNEFSDARQLAAWVGLTPSHHQSGTSGRTRTPITKIGSIHLRRALYMPAMNARVFNPLLKTFADRLIANGKKPKQVIIAVMRKLLHQIYGILKSGEPYNPEKRGYAGSRNLPPLNQNRTTI